MEDTVSRSEIEVEVEVALRRSPRLLGMGNPENGSNQLAPSMGNLENGSNHLAASMGDPENGSNQFALRRSARLIESRRIMSERTQLAPCKPSRRSHKTSQLNRKIRNFEFFDFGKCPITFRSILDIDSLRLSTRQANAQHFWIAYSHVYDTIPVGSLNIKERKHILVSNRKIFNEIDESHGMMWVAVHGTGFICAVFRNKAPDMKRILESLGRGVIMTYFGKYVLSHMEDIADSSEYQIDGKPFAVVSVAQGSENAADENCYKASGDELDEEKAVEFLMSEMARESALTKKETIKTAIAGFHYLFKEKLKPEEIWVTFFHDDGRDDHFEDLDDRQIKKYMDEINKPRSQLPRKTRCSNESFSSKLRRKTRCG